MKDDTHNDTWQTLSAATENLLSKKQNPTKNQERAADREHGEAAKENPIKERAYIDRSLRHLTTRR